MVFKKGNVPWCKGLTKDTDRRLKKLGKNVSKTKLKLGSAKGINNGMYGKKHSDKTKQQISNTRKVRIQKGEILLYNKGKHFSKMHRLHISESKKKTYKEHPEILKQISESVKLNAKTNPNFGTKGYKFSIESREKMSEKRLARRTRLGYIHSPTARIKQGNSLKKTYKEHPEILEKTLRASAKSRGIRPNKCESILLNIIKRNKLPFNYVGNGKIYFRDSARNYNPDFLSKNPKHIIEVFGDYWHNKDIAIQVDKSRLRAYAKYGYKTLVIWEHELYELSELAIVNKINKFLKK